MLNSLMLHGTLNMLPTNLCHFNVNSMKILLTTMAIVIVLCEHNEFLLSLKPVNKVHEKR